MLFLQKEVRIPTKKITQDMLQSKYGAILHQTKFDFQGTTMISVDLFNEYGSFYPIVVQFKTHWII